MCLNNSLMRYIDHKQETRMNYCLNILTLMFENICIFYNFYNFKEKLCVDRSNDSAPIRNNDV